MSTLIVKVLKKWYTKLNNFVMISFSEKKAIFLTFCYSQKSENGMDTQFIFRKEFIYETEENTLIFSAAFCAAFADACAKYKRSSQIVNSRFKKCQICRIQ